MEKSKRLLDVLLTNAAYLNATTLKCTLTEVLPGNLFILAAFS